MDTTRLRAKSAALAGRLLGDLTSPEPFGRLARAHVLMVAGDTLVTVALAGSLFFSISPNAARSRVALYLAITIAPFAVVGPALGPLLDRSRRARKALVLASSAARVVLCLLMAADLHGLLLFPEAFGVLVASKLWLVAKASLVPATVEGQEGLVRANSRLSLLGSLAGFLAGGIGAAVLEIPFLGAPWVLRLDAVVLAAATVAATRLSVPRLASTQGPRPAAPTSPASDGWSVAAVRPRRSIPAPQARESPASTLVAAAAMAVLRGSVGFVTFFLAFGLRRQHAALIWYGLVLVASTGGSLLATQVAPVLRRRHSEEALIGGSLVLVTLAGVGAALLAGAGAQSLLALGVGLAAGTAKLGFDSLVQRDTGESAQGRAFARFETRFQLAWVIGAIVPVVTVLATRPGDLVVAIVAGVAAASFAAGRHALAAGGAAGTGGGAGRAAGTGGGAAGTGGGTGPAGDVQDRPAPLPAGLRPRRRRW